MSGIIDYIVGHSAWIIGGAILIILAIIGYYADKTNFGQGKNAKPEEPKKLDNIDEIRINDVVEEEPIAQKVSEEKPIVLEKVEEVPNDVSNLTEPLNLNNTTVNNQEQVNLTEDLTKPIESPKKEKTSVSLEEEIKSMDFLDAVEERISKKSLEENQIVKENTEIKPAVNKTNKTTKTKKVKLTAEEAAFNKFEKEFESLLPKKEIINTDLLSDIDELELGKTQKIKINEVPDLDDIDLPKIKKLVTEEQDIWKF